MGKRYEDLNREELLRLLEARDRRTKFGLVWEADEIERDKALNNDFVALDLVPELCVGLAPWRNLIIEAALPPHDFRRTGQVHPHRSAL